MEQEKINDINDYLYTIFSYVLKKNPSLIETWKQEIEGHGNPLQNAIHIFEITGTEYKKRPTGTILAKLFWIMKTYLWTPGNKLEGLMAWNDFLMNSRHDNDRDLNAASSQREIINFLMDKGITIEEIERLQDKNTLRGKGNAKEINRKILNEAKKKAIENIKNKPELPKGFDCPLPSPTVKKIYDFMTDNEYIKGDLQHFQAIFSNPSNTVTKPIQWLKKSQRKEENTKRYRGHQTQLHCFLETMLNRHLTSPEKRKTRKLFIDEHGEFFNPESRRPTELDKKTTHATFLKHLNMIINPDNK